MSLEVDELLPLHTAKSHLVMQCLKGKNISYSAPDVIGVSIEKVVFVCVYCVFCVCLLCVYCVCLLYVFVIIVGFVCVYSSSSTMPLMLLIPNH